MTYKNILVSHCMDEFKSQTDIQIKKQLSEAESERKELLIDLDCSISNEDISQITSEIDAIDKIIFKLDDELCARGL